MRFGWEEGWSSLLRSSVDVTYGHYLVFDYDGKRAVFHVVAIGMSAIEIEHPAVGGIDDNDQDHGSGQLKRPRIELENDADLGLRRSDKTQAPFFDLSRKSARASQSSNLEGEKMRGNSPIASGDELVETDHTIVKIGRRCRNLTNDQTEKAILRTKAFQSEESICIIALQPSYMNLKSGVNKKCQLVFPLSFTEAYFTFENRDITLQAGDGRIWSVKYSLARESSVLLMVGSSWKQLAIDHDL
uniref:TF-B3 domain-containing protein n=1 Tax=Kalanchoe fedtschenkoi TaxID=63787 RepID=A0A7N0UWR7_KALFE